jgi:hypothetical protein
MTDYKQNVQKRVYIAGALNAPTAEYLQNVSRMENWALQVQALGCAVYVPCEDILRGILHGQMNYEDYFKGSQEWLKVSEAVFLVPGWENSKGTKREIRLARKLHIPVFKDLEKLKKFINK